jgi:hypothetical protein
MLFFVLFFLKLGVAWLDLGANNGGLFVLIDTGIEKQGCHRWNFRHFSECEFLMRLINRLSG